MFSEWPIVTAATADGSYKWAMSRQVAKDRFLLVKSRYSEAELSVLQAFHCLFVSEVPGRMAPLEFSGDRTAQALRAVGR